MIFIIMMYIITRLDDFLFFVLKGDNILKQTLTFKANG